MQERELLRTKGDKPCVMPVRKVEDPIWGRMDDTVLTDLLQSYGPSPEEPPPDWDPFAELREDVSLWPDEDIRTELHESSLLEFADFLDEYLPLLEGYTNIYPPEGPTSSTTPCPGPIVTGAPCGPGASRVGESPRTQFQSKTTTTCTVTVEDLEIDLGLRSPPHNGSHACSQWKEAAALPQLADVNTMMDRAPQPKMSRNDNISDTNNTKNPVSEPEEEVNEMNVEEDEDTNTMRGECEYDDGYDEEEEEEEGYEEGGILIDSDLEERTPSVSVMTVSSSPALSIRVPVTPKEKKKSKNNKKKKLKKKELRSAAFEEKKMKKKKRSKKKEDGEKCFGQGGKKTNVKKKDGEGKSKMKMKSKVMKR